MDATHDAYIRKAQSKASVAQGENATRNSRDDVVIQENMSPNWTHPFHGPKAFFDKFVRLILQLQIGLSLNSLVHLYLSTSFLVYYTSLLMK